MSETDDAKLAEIRARAEAALQTIGNDTPWPLRDCVAKLIEAAGILLHKKSYDGHGHEEIRHAMNNAAVYLESINNDHSDDRATLLSDRAAAQERVRELEGKQLNLARAYDPNCDEYHYEEQLAAMKAARQTVEAVQELAKYLGRDPEGCLSDVPDEAMGKIEELEAKLEQAQEQQAAQAAELERVRGERDVAQQAATAWHALMNGIEAIRDAQTDPDFTPDQRLNAYIDVYTRLKQEKKDLEASLAAEREKVAALTRERDEALRQCREWAQKAGLAQGELAASEMAGNLREWKERAERAEGELAKMRPRAERITTAFVDYILKHSTLCPAGAYQLVDELTAQVLPTPTAAAKEGE